MEASISGPHYWFVLHTISFHYPLHPTSIQKKIYHRLIHNLHEFLPNKTMGNTYQSILIEHPVTPYLDTRADFIKWMHMMHNKINTRLDRPTMSLADHYAEYEKLCEPRPSRMKRLWNEKKKIVYTLFIIITVVYTYLSM